MPYKNPEDKRRYSVEHREEQRAYWKRYAVENKEKRAEQARRYAIANKEKLAAKAKKYGVENKDKIIAYRKLYYERSREKQIEYGRAWRKAHPEKGAQRYARMRAERSNTIVSLTAEQIKEMKKVGCLFADGTCRGFLSVAHDTPFSLGGNTTRGNTFILCKRHNSMMHTKSLKEMLVQKELPI